MPHRPLVLGVAGGSGSGKSTVVREVARALGEDRVAVIRHDWYYRDLAHLPYAERCAVNFDHPDALETDLLVRQVDALLRGDTVEAPSYDYATHTRARRVVRIEPKPVVILDGILVLAEPDLRERMDLKVFVDTDADIRLLRRLRRDTVERGRTAESVLDQYERTVRPMHLEFVEPSRRYADLIIPEGGYNREAVALLVTRLRTMLAEEDPRLIHPPGTPVDH